MVVDVAETVITSDTMMVSVDSMVLMCDSVET